MIICAAGDTHGAIDRLYANVLAFEQGLGMTFDCVLHVGDFGIWPDPERIDRATRKHDGAGDFATWLVVQRSAPRPTVFIKGNHEDFDWLEAQASAEVLPGLTYLRNGQATTVSSSRGSVCIAGVGGCFGPGDFERKSAKLEGRARAHYTRDEVDTVCHRRGVDILLLHDAPAGVRFAARGGRSAWVSATLGLDRAINTLRPSIVFFGHHHVRVDTVIGGVTCIGLGLIDTPGHLVAIEVAADRSVRILGHA